MATAAHSLQRLAVGLAGAHARLPPLPQLRTIASLRCLGSHTTCLKPSSAACAAGFLQQQQHWQQQVQRRRLPPSAAFSVVTDGGDGSGGGGGAEPWKLIVYSKEGCHLCDGLKEKIEALLDRAAFMPSALSAAELEVRDITTNPDWEQRYAMSIPVLATAAADGSGEVEVPRPSPRFSADALQKHIEKFLAAQQQRQ